MKFEFSWQIYAKKSYQISNFMTIRAVGAQLLLADRQIDRQAEVPILIVAFFL
jgi:hypothetical protein